MQFSVPVVILGKMNCLVVHSVAAVVFLFACPPGVRQRTPEHLLTPGRQLPSHHELTASPLEVSCIVWMDSFFKPEQLFRNSWTESLLDTTA